MMTDTIDLALEAVEMMMIGLETVAQGGSEMEVGSELLAPRDRRPNPPRLNQLRMSVIGARCLFNSLLQD
jgi:hypothetical protein